MKQDLRQDPAQKSGEILVFLIRKETKCSECGKELWSRQAERRQVREAELDHQFVTAFASAIVREFPSCPLKTANRIEEHACLRSRGRVGRSAAAKQFDATPVRLAVTAAVRDQFANYDGMLSEGIERLEARALVSSDAENKLDQWRKAPPNVER